MIIKFIIFKLIFIICFKIYNPGLRGIMSWETKNNISDKYLISPACTKPFFYINVLSFGFIQMSFNWKLLIYFKRFIHHKLTGCCECFTCEINLLMQTSSWLHLYIRSLKYLSQLVFRLQLILRIQFWIFAQVITSVRNTHMFHLC